jgi:hypothetical protein
MHTRWADAVNGTSNDRGAHVAISVEAAAGTPTGLQTTAGLKSWAVILLGTFTTVAAGAWLARRHLEPAWYFGEPPFYERTVIPHAATMTALVALALLVIGPLLRANLPVVALFVAGSISCGPLSLLAAPIFTTPDSYENPRTIESVFPWIVGSVVTGLLLVAAHHLNGTSTPVRKPNVVGLTLIGALMVLPLLTLPALLAGEDDLFEYPTFFPLGQALIVTGSALLAGGLMTVGLLAVDRPLNSVLRLAVTGLALALGHWAYDREGGAPTVPGWDYNTSPHLISAPTTILLITTATIGLVLRVTHIREHMSSLTVEPASDAPVGAERPGNSS